MMKLMYFKRKNLIDCFLVLKTNLNNNYRSWVQVPSPAPKQVIER